MPLSHWREKSREVIVQAIAEARAQGLEGAALKKHISAAYPFGLREMHPYKIWLDEVKRQLKQKPHLGSPIRPRDHPGQQRLFK